MTDSENQKTVFALHTSFALIDLLGSEFREQLPDVRIVNIVDDSLLADVRSADRVTPSVMRRMVGYATLAQSAGADAIFNCCSSVGEAADVIRQIVEVPVVKIDEAMTGEAVARGERIAVVATVPTTLEPTARLIERKAREAGKIVEIRRRLADGAFDLLLAGDTVGHDAMVSAEIKRAADEADVVVLAQASMSRLVGKMNELSTPVLSSPASGVAELKRVLANTLPATAIRMKALGVSDAITAC